MAVVSILDAFTYKWAQLGTSEAITDDQWKVGWSFIGAVPPSVEQFNKWGQIFDEKSNYLYSQLKTIYDLVGVVPGAADVNSLRDSLRGTGLFVTAAPGTNDTKVATTAFVAAAVTAAAGRLVRTLVFTRIAGVQNVSINGGTPTTTGAATYVPTVGISFADAEVQGAGSGGAGSSGAGASNVSVGSPGSSGSYARARFTAAQLGASQTVTVGAGSAGSSSLVGGTSSLGALATAPGGTGSAQVANVAPPTNNGNGVPANAPTGANLYAIRGISPFVTVGLSASSGFGGAGGASPFGQGAPGPAFNSAGVNALNYGTGGSGTVVNQAGGTATGGNGADGIVIIREYT